MTNSSAELTLTNRLFEACHELSDHTQTLIAEANAASSAQETTAAFARFEPRLLRLERKVLRNALRLADHWATRGTDPELMHSTVHGAAIQTAVAQLPDKDVVDAQLSVCLRETESVCSRLAAEPAWGDTDEPWSKLIEIKDRHKAVIGQVVEAATTAYNWNLERNQDAQIEGFKQAARTTPGMSLTVDEVAQFPDGGWSTINHEKIEGPSTTAE